MKILILANNSAGVYIFRRELIEELLKNHEVIVSTPYDGYQGKIRKIGCKIVSISIDRRGINPIKDLFLFYQYNRLIKKEKPDHIITYTIKPNIYGGLLCRLKKISYTANITGLGTVFQKRGILQQIVIQMYKKALKDAKTVFFENGENQKFFLNKGIVKKNQSYRLDGAGVNLEYFRLQPYPIKDTPIKFLFIGRMMREKGIDELLKVMKQLHNEGIDCILDILGLDEEQYKEKLQTAEAEGWLHYYGYQKDVRPFIAEAHCFVLPSWHEGMANTNLECAASGRPVITSNISGCKEAVMENISGFLCTPQDVHSLYQTMKLFIILPNEKRKDMGIEGRKLMEKKFDKRKVVEKTITKMGLK